MEFIKHETTDGFIAEIKTRTILIKEPQDILDLVVNVGTDTIIIQKDALDQSFFDLKSGFAGEVLYKTSTYRIRLGVIGDFSRYESKSLKAFIVESNRTNQVVFVNAVKEAIQRFS